MSSPPSTNCHVSLCYKAASSSVSLGHPLTPLQHQGGWFLPNPTNPWGMVGNVVPKARLQGAGQHCQPRMVLQGLEVKTNLLRQQLCFISHEISRHPPTAAAATGAELVVPHCALLSCPSNHWYPAECVSNLRGTLPCLICKFCTTTVLLRDCIQARLWLIPIY